MLPWPGNSRADRPWYIISSTVVGRGATASQICAYRIQLRAARPAAPGCCGPGPSGWRRPAGPRCRGRRARGSRPPAAGRPPRSTASVRGWGQPVLGAQLRQFGEPVGGAVVVGIVARDQHLLGSQKGAGLEEDTVVVTHVGVRAQPQHLDVDQPQPGVVEAALDVADQRRTAHRRSQRFFGRSPDQPQPHRVETRRRRHVHELVGSEFEHGQGASDSARPPSPRWASSMAVILGIAQARWGATFSRSSLQQSAIGRCRGCSRRLATTQKVRMGTPAAARCGHVGCRDGRDRSDTPTGAGRHAVPADHRRRRRGCPGPFPRPAAPAHPSGGRGR